MHRNPPGLQTGYNNYEDVRRSQPGTPSMQGSPTHQQRSSPHGFDDPSRSSQQSQQQQMQQGPPGLSSGRNSRQPTPQQHHQQQRNNNNNNNSNQRNNNGPPQANNNAQQPMPTPPRGRSNSNNNQKFSIPSTPQFEKISRGGMSTAGSDMGAYGGSHPQLGDDDTVRVVVRIRPMNSKESEREEGCVLEAQQSAKSLQVRTGGRENVKQYGKVFKSERCEQM